jgi:hypothetical protein
MIVIIFVFISLLFLFLFSAGIYLLRKLVFRNNLSLFERIFLGIYLSFVVLVSGYFIFKILL